MAALVVTRGDGPGLLEAADRPFDGVAFLVWTAWTVRLTRRVEQGGSVQCPPGLQPGGGTFAGSAQPGVVAVVLPAVLG
ncbi:hypothetical protein GCM10010266_65670 [Streptomyces griseomycini]|nr:hypothetical protein GCM10010266_65670 [Streptomyces griseomycini]